MKQTVIPFLKDIEFICNPSCSHPFDEWPFFNYKRAIAATHSFKFTVLLQQKELQQGDIVTNVDTSLVSGMCILKEVCYLTESVYSGTFFLW